MPLNLEDATFTKSGKGLRASIGTISLDDADMRAVLACVEGQAGLVDLTLRAATRSITSERVESALQRLIAQGYVRATAKQSLQFALGMPSDPFDLDFSAWKPQ